MCSFVCICIIHYTYTYTAYTSNNQIKVKITFMVNMIIKFVTNTEYWRDFLLKYEATTLGVEVLVDPLKKYKVCEREMKIHNYKYQN